MCVVYLKTHIYIISYKVIIYIYIKKQKSVCIHVRRNSFLKYDVVFCVIIFQISCNPDVIFYAW